MNILHTVRVVVLGLFIPNSCLNFDCVHPLTSFNYAGLVLLFSFIVLALAAALTNTTESDGFYFTFAALALAVSIITLLIVTPM